MILTKAKKYPKTFLVLIKLTLKKTDKASKSIITI